MSQRLPLISIVIPVKNGGSWLDNLLRSIFAQSLIGDTEVIIIDSGSTDQSVDTVREFPVQLIQISPDDFNHGATRNVGAQVAKGKYVVMTVQDALPENDRWLELLISPFSDDSVAGVCGQQIVPHDRDTNPVQWHRPISLPVLRKIYFESVEKFDALTADEKRRLCSWDDVNAAYRRDVLLRIPFRKVSFAEDALWARDALRAGYAIVYEPNARVKHYHFESSDYTFRRLFTVSYHFYMAFGTKPELVENGMLELSRDIKTLLLSPGISLSEKVKWLYFNFQQRKAINRAVKLFHQSLHSGPSHLERTHAEFCEQAPQSLSRASVT